MCSTLLDASEFLWQNIHILMLFFYLGIAMKSQRMFYLDMYLNDWGACCISKSDKDFGSSYLVTRPILIACALDRLLKYDM